jgi:hypothetical protein
MKLIGGISVSKASGCLLESQPSSTVPRFLRPKYINAKCILQFYSAGDPERMRMQIEKIVSTGCSVCTD